LPSFNFLKKTEITVIDIKTELIFGMVNDYSPLLIVKQQYCGIQVIFLP